VLDYLKEDIMKVVLIIVSILLIAIVLLQAGKAEGASAAMMGGNDSLFKNRKERGGELFITRLTLVLGIIFFVICLIIGF
jgi:preprotein translocase subunit SecG